MTQYIGRAVVSGFLVLLVLGGSSEVLGAWGLSAPAQVALVIFLIAATLWISEAVPLFVTSFVILLLNLVWLEPVMTGAGAAPARDRFLAPFFSDIILLFLGGFVMSAALKKFRLDEQLARRIIARTGRSLPRLILSIMSTTAFLSMWLSNTATAAMMLALCLPIIKGLRADDPCRKALILAVPFAANLGGLGTPVGSPPNAIALLFMRQQGLAPSFGFWMLLGIPGVAVMLGVAWLVLVTLYRARQRSLAFEVAPMPPADPRSGWLVGAVSLLTVTGWITSAWHGYTAGTVALIPVLVFFGTRMLSLEDLRSLSWDVLLIMGGGGSLGVAMEVSGLADWFIAQVSTEQASLFALVVLFACVAVVLSSVMSSTATASLVLPVVTGLEVESLAPIAVGVAFACNLAMPLPISTPPNAMAYSAGRISVADMLKLGGIITIVGLALACTTGYWWWRLVGLF